MKRNRGFDEVMIVNPYEPGSETNQGVKLMRFYSVPQTMGYYAESPGAYGYYAEPPEMYGYYAMSPQSYGEIEPGYNEYEPMGYYSEYEPVGYFAEEYPMGYYGEYEPMGYYGEYEPMGYYGEYEPMGYYGEYEPMGHYAEYEPMGYYSEYEPMGYYGEYEPMGYYGEYEPVGYYSEAREMPGYAEYDPMAMQPGMAEYGEGYDGYVRETRPRFNPGCPMPTNVHGFGEAETFQGYVRPSTVNPTCGQFTPQPGQEPQPPDNFKPLW